MRWLARATKLIMDLALPGGCCGCGAHLQAGEGPWCTDCALALGRTAQKPYCPRCGLTTDGTAWAADGCPRCMNEPTLLDGFARIGEYDGLLTSLIRRYKFARHQHLDRPLGGFLTIAIQNQPWACELDGLVPVPVSWRSRFAYRFSPPQALARHIAGEMDLPMLPLLYDRGKRRRQVGLSLDERRLNVRGTFRLRRGARPAGGILCVIDDVSTTGSTVQEVARVLKAAGATRVYAAALAKTNPDRATALNA